MAKVAFFRHAQSTYNAGGDLSRNVPITPFGVEQSKSMVGHAGLVICSTLKRARQTLDASNLKYKRVIFTDLCREIMADNTSDFYDLEDLKMETDEDIKKRMEAFKKFILSQPEATDQFINIAVVSHGMFLGRLTGVGYVNCGLHVSTITS